MKSELRELHSKSEELAAANCFEVGDHFISRMTMNLGSILSSHIHPSARKAFNSHEISTSPVDADDDDNLLGSDATLKPGRAREI